MPNILPIIILYNSKAGKGRAVHIVDFIIKKLTGIGVSFNSYDKQWPEQLSEYKEVWLVGGDGTLNFFINKYPDCKIPVALFKGGSGNDFAWKLYGNIKTEAYFETALNGRIVFTDAGCCNSRLFINGAGVGFDGETVRNMGAKKFLSAGHIAYLIVVVKTIFKYRESKMKVCFNDKVLQKEYLMITIANGSRYGGEIGRAHV